jgi:hypothetical protein
MKCTPEVHAYAVHAHEVHACEMHTTGWRKKRGERQKSVLGLGDTVLGLGDTVLGLGDAVPGLGDTVPGLGDTVPGLAHLKDLKGRGHHHGEVLRTGNTLSYQLLKSRRI